MSSYDPVHTSHVEESFLLENIYSPLVELDPKGGITPGIAKRFEWVGDEAHFTFRTDLKTVDGRPITAEDGAFSLNRLLMLEKTSHGDLHGLLCPDQPIISLKNPCRGISVKGNVLILKPLKKKFFLFPMLASIDFAVLPRQSVDPRTLQIKDYRNTTGPYYVEKDEGGGKITLLANRGHYHYSDVIPQKVELVPAGWRDPRADAALDFTAGKVDFLSTLLYTGPTEKVLALGTENAHWTMYQSMNLGARILLFSGKGLRTLSPNVRVAVGKTLRQVLESQFLKGDGQQVTRQLFPPFGDGALSEKEMEEIEVAQKPIAPATDGKGLLISVLLPRFDQVAELIKKALPGAIVKSTVTPPAFLDPKTPDSEMPQIFICDVSTGFIEDFGLITHAIAFGAFGLGKNDGAKWITEYGDLENKGQRLAKLRKLHRQALETGVLFPVFSEPFFSFLRKPWRSEMSTLSGDIQLWLVKRK